jgi:HAD superfamily hydrolase (TIGR01509 family)
MTSPPLEAVVFDMDGVLFDTEPVHMRAWREILAADGLLYDDAFFADWIGIPDEDLGAWLAERHPAGGGAEGFLARKRARFRAIVEAELTAFAGLAPWLERLAAAVPLAVATSSQRADLELMLEKTGLAPYFRATCTHNDVAEHKPHPAPYLLAAQRLGVAPERCAAVEDSPSGVAAARAAGMLTLAVSSAFEPAALAAADEVFPATVAACRWLAPRLGAGAPGGGS